MKIDISSYWLFQRCSLMAVLFLVSGLVTTGFAQQPGRGVGVRIQLEGRDEKLYEESHALLIGVSEYTAGWRNLNGVKKDMENVRKVLEKQGFRIKEVNNPSRDKLNDELRKFVTTAGAKERNRLLIYFAGHGYTEQAPDGREVGYFVPTDAPLPAQAPQRFAQRAISMSEIDALAFLMKARHALFIFDSCFAGTIFETRGDDWRIPAEIQNKTLAPVRQFITSGGKDQTVPDQSIFCQYFIRAFDYGEADSNHDGYVTGEELGLYLRGRVSAESRETQIPQYGKIRDARLNLGDFVFVLPPKPVNVVATAPPAPNCTSRRESERALWGAIAASNDAEEYQLFLDKYQQDNSECIFCDAAQAHLRRLAKVAKEVVTPNAESQPKTDPSLDPPAKRRREVLSSETATTAVATERKLPPFTLVDMPFETGTISSRGVVTRKSSKPAQGYLENLDAGINLEMVYVRGGTFKRGSPPNEVGRRADEALHSVRVSEFYIGRYEITQAQWEVVMEGLPAAMQLRKCERFSGPQRPVACVTWTEAQEFCERLSAKTGRRYRLPTEAEWEYAARAGTQTRFAWGDVLTPEVANYNRYYGVGIKARDKQDLLGRPSEVGYFNLANAFGLFDMHGNVWEWCADWYGLYDPNYKTREMHNPRGPSKGTERVLRGGSWGSALANCRAASRQHLKPDEYSNVTGLRVVLELPPQ